MTSLFIRFKIWNVCPPNFSANVKREGERSLSRENFRSRLGFILVSAGCAIGIGNVWKFPYVTGVNGGGVFVLFYIISLVIMGVPILTMELAVGRASRKSAVLGYKALEPKGQPLGTSTAGCA